MERIDLLLLEKLVPQHDELRKLVVQHRGYEEQIETLMGHRWLSDVERQELRDLKKRKLRGRDRIEAILTGYRRERPTM